MANHGAVTYAETLLNAFLKMETLEHFAHISLVAEQLGSPRLLEDHSIGQLLDAKSKYLRNSR
jgi:L-fuculose-phosphate aldolase